MNEIGAQMWIRGENLPAGKEVSRRERDAIRKVAREFEALMVNEMLKSMRATVQRDSLLGGRSSEDIYRSMLDQEYAAAIASQGGVGLAPLIERELLERSAVQKGGNRDGNE